MPKAWVHPQVFQGVHRQLWSDKYRDIVIGALHVRPPRDSNN